MSLEMAFKLHFFCKKGWEGHNNYKQKLFGRRCASPLVKVADFMDVFWEQVLKGCHYSHFVRKWVNRKK